MWRAKTVHSDPSLRFFDWLSGRSFGGWHGDRRGDRRERSGRRYRWYSDGRQSVTGSSGSVLTLIDAAKVEGKRDDEKCDRSVNRGFRKNVARVGSESRFGHATAHGGTHATVGLGLLGQNDQDEKQRQNDEGEGEYTEDDAHGKDSENSGGADFVNGGIDRLSWINALQVLKKKA